MLYTIFGNDIEKVRSRSHDLVKALQEKRPDASFFRLHLENFANDKLTELLGSFGLFSSKYIVVLDNLLTGSIEKKENDESKPSDLIEEQLENFKKSEHVWIIVEDALFGSSSGKELGIRESKSLEDIRKKLEKVSDKMEIQEIKSKSTSQSFRKNNNEISSFTFTDAFFEKNKVGALNALTLLKRQEIAPEEIHGALWWQTKALLQVSVGEDKKLSPFVVGKTKRFLNKWKEEDISKLSSDMVEGYHFAHLGKTELEDELVRMVLRLN